MIQRFERQPDDDDRRFAWEAHVMELDNLWKEYRKAGSTPRAWLQYREAAAEAKRRYVFDDIYLAPVLPVPGVDAAPRTSPTGKLFPAKPSITQEPVILSLPNYKDKPFEHGEPLDPPLP